MSVIYEVNLAVERGIQEAFGNWLAVHIDEMLALPGFASANWWVVEKESDSHVYWSVHYILESRAALERYFQEFAPTMRGDGIQRFGGQFEAERRILSSR